MSSEIGNLLYKIIVLIVILTIVLLIVPNGKIKGTVKTVFSLAITVFIINGSIIFLSEKNCINSFDYSYNQENFLNYYIEKKQEKTIEKIKQILSENNVIFNDVNVLIYEENLSIEEIVIEIPSSFINENTEHIFLIDEVKKKISENLLINKENVNFDVK